MLLGLEMTTTPDQISKTEATGRDKIKDEIISAMISY